MDESNSWSINPSRAYGIWSLRRSLISRWLWNRSPNRTPRSSLTQIRHKFDVNLEKIRKRKVLLVRAYRTTLWFPAWWVSAPSTWAVGCCSATYRSRKESFCYLAWAATQPPVGLDWWSKINFPKRERNNFLRLHRRKEKKIIPKD